MSWLIGMLRKLWDAIFGKNEAQDVNPEWVRKKCKSCRYYDGRTCWNGGKQYVKKPDQMACERWAKRRVRKGHSVNKK